MRQSEQSLMSREQELQQLLEQLYIQEIYADNAIENAITNTPASSSTNSTSMSSQSSSTTIQNNQMINQCKSPINLQKSMFSPNKTQTTHELKEDEEIHSNGQFVELKIINQENYDPNYFNNQQSRRKQIPIYNANDILNQEQYFQTNSAIQQHHFNQQKAHLTHNGYTNNNVNALNHHHHQKSLSIGNLTANQQQQQQQGTTPVTANLKLTSPNLQTQSNQHHFNHLVMSPNNTNQVVSVNHSNSISSNTSNGLNNNLKQSPSLDLNANNNANVNSNPKIGNYSIQFF